jgi:hypothetical protein
MNRHKSISHAKFIHRELKEMGETKRNAAGLWFINLPGNNSKLKGMGTRETSIFWKF